MYIILGVYDILCAHSSCLAQSQSSSESWLDPDLLPVHSNSKTGSEMEPSHSLAHKRFSGHTCTSSTLYTTRNNLCVKS